MRSTMGSLLSVSIWSRVAARPVGELRERAAELAFEASDGYSFGNGVKLLHITPEPKPISIGIAAPKGRLTLAAEKFWQCAKEAASKK